MNFQWKKNYYSIFNTSDVYVRCLVFSKMELMGCMEVWGKARCNIFICRWWFHGCVLRLNQPSNGFCQVCWGNFCFSLTIQLRCSFTFLWSIGSLYEICHKPLWKHYYSEWNHIFVQNSTSAYAEHVDKPEVFFCTEGKEN